MAKIRIGEKFKVGRKPKLENKIKCRDLVATKSRLEERKETLEKITKRSLKERIKEEFGTKIITFDPQKKDLKNLIKLAKSEKCEIGDNEQMITCSETSSARQSLEPTSKERQLNSFEKEAKENFLEIERDFECQRELGRLER